MELPRHTYTGPCGQTPLNPNFLASGIRQQFDATSIYARSKESAQEIGRFPRRILSKIMTTSEGDLAGCDAGREGRNVESEAAAKTSSRNTGRIIDRLKSKRSGIVVEDGCPRRLQYMGSCKAAGHNRAQYQSNDHEEHECSEAPALGPLKIRGVIRAKDAPRFR